MLKKGFRWILGDGDKINVFNDAWLRVKSNFCVDSNTNNSGSIRKAKDLFKPGVKEWDVNKVYGNFQNCEARAILATSIPQY